MSPFRRRWDDRGWVRTPDDPKVDTWDEEDTMVLPETVARRLRERLRIVHQNTDVTGSHDHGVE